MLFGRYRIECSFENEAILPYFKGSTIRGVFGIALKRVVCALKQLKCEECLLSER
ncbi:MAG: CRISPR-associated protein Cas6, partial [Deltaproteobacteria bacterium]